MRPLLFGAAIVPWLLGCAREQTPPPAEPAHAAASAEPHWGYGAEGGPATWSTLDAKYAVCSTGRAQSPIDIAGATRDSVSPAASSTYRPTPLRIVFHEAKADLVNTGHSIQVTAPGDDTVMVGTDRYTLVQFHFHSPSEHTIGGVSFPLEMHLVHQSSDGRLAVVGVLIREGAYNKAFDAIWSKLPELKAQGTAHDSVMVSIEDLLPDNRTHYRYDGSLTTPPCTEGVKWFVLETPVELSAAQIAAFRAVLSGNSRPVQPLNGRAITEAVVPR
jgi:carbonic anhydrase